MSSQPSVLQYRHFNDVAGTKPNVDWRWHLNNNILPNIVNRLQEDWKASLSESGISDHNVEELVDNASGYAKMTIPSIVHNIPTFSRFAGFARSPDINGQRCVIEMGYRSTRGRSYEAACYFLPIYYACSFECAVQQR